VAVGAAPWSWGYWPYYNPYCVPTVVVEGTTIDYSQPIIVQPAATADSSQPAQTDDQGTQLLNAARDAFMQGQYQTALTQVNQAIAKQPNAPVAHELRGLVLFALKQYKPAAATIYAVLSVGPGWDWTTMSSLYPSVDTYTEQLRSLEQYCRQNPTSTEARFLLAYHYITCGHTDAAVKTLQDVVQLNPKDKLAAQLLRGLSGGEAAAQPAPAASTAPAAPVKPVEASALVGTWKASRDDGSSFTLDLGADGKYRWQFQQNGKSQEFSGPYSVADGLLILKQGNSPTMVGQVTPIGATQFNFKLAGDNPNDPGLTFSK
jgi:tetratricopeptide (TPR) repeat protein